MRAPRAFKEIHSLTFERRETKKWLFRLPPLQCVGQNSLSPSPNYVEKEQNQDSTASDEGGMLQLPYSDENKCTPQRPHLPSFYFC